METNNEKSSEEELKKDKALNERIKKKFVNSKGVDKFTKNEEYSLADSISLDKSKLDIIADNRAGVSSFNSELENISARLQRSSFYLYLDFVYRKNSGQDIFFVKLRTSQVNLSGNDFRVDLLKDGEIIFLIDDEPNKINKSLSYTSGTSEEIVLETDMSLLSNIVNAKKVEYRVQGANGIFSESTLPKGDILKFIGFYNSIFDNSFKKSELIKSMKPKPKPKPKRKPKAKASIKSKPTTSEKNVDNTNKWYSKWYDKKILWVVVVLGIVNPIFLPFAVFGTYKRFFSAKKSIK